MAVRSPGGGSSVDLASPGTIGGTTPGAATFTKITLTTGTITVSTPAISGTQTWNDGAVTFTASTINVTDTASAAASLLQDLQIGGSSKYKVDKYGGIIVPASDSAAGAATNTGLFFGSAKASNIPALIGFNGQLYARADGSVVALLGPDGNGWSSKLVQLHGTAGVLCWSHGNAPNGNPNTGLCSSANGRVEVNQGRRIADGGSLGELLFKLPESDPALAGALWNNAGTITISSG